MNSSNIKNLFQKPHSFRKKASHRVVYPYIILRHSSNVTLGQRVVVDGGNIWVGGKVILFSAVIHYQVRNNVLKNEGEKVFRGYQVKAAAKLGLPGKWYCK